MTSLFSPLHAALGAPEQRVRYQGTRKRPSCAHKIPSAGNKSLLSAGYPRQPGRIRAAMATHWAPGLLEISSCIPRVLRCSCLTRSLGSGGGETVSRSRRQEVLPPSVSATGRGIGAGWPRNTRRVLNGHRIRAPCRHLGGSSRYPAMMGIRDGGAQSDLQYGRASEGQPRGVAPSGNTV